MNMRKKFHTAKYFPTEKSYYFDSGQNKQKSKEKNSYRKQKRGRERERDSTIKTNEHKIEMVFELKIMYLPSASYG